MGLLGDGQKANVEAKEEIHLKKGSQARPATQRETVYWEADPEKLLLWGKSFNCLNILRVVSEMLYVVRVTCGNLKYLKV